MSEHSDDTPSQRLTVLHVISGLTVGGAEMMLCKLLAATDLAATCPVVVSLSQGGELVSEIEALGIPVHQLPMPGGLPRPGFVRRFRSVVDAVGPDVVASWMYRANALCSALIPIGIPVIWHVRQSLDHNSSQRLLFRFTRRVNRRILRSWPGRAPALVLYNSKTSRDQHRAAGYTAPADAVIPNGFDLDRFQPDPDARAGMRTEWGLGGDEPLVFGIVGRHHPIKNHFGFVRAAAKARDLLVRGESERNSSFRCVMVGRGLDRGNNALLREIEAHGLADRMVLLGERRDLPRVYAGMDILVSASLVEAFPNVLGEAMAAGVPCIATSVGDSSWIVGETGVVVAPGDPGILGEAMAAAAQWPRDERRRRSEAARARVQEEFSIEAVATAFATTYRDVAGKYGGAR